MTTFLHKVSEANKVPEPVLLELCTELLLRWSNMDSSTLVPVGDMAYILALKQSRVATPRVVSIVATDSVRAQDSGG